ncbi:MAG: prepilin peptidase [Candidatus Thorarchaeota archaeon]|jgi:Flp pilus assembly protein protease CpaA|nr:prepilin peptidase [Candidatus Thorarchaeota archaeon]
MSNLTASVFNPLLIAPTISFATAVILLLMFSLLDIRERKVSNGLLAAGGLVGCVVSILTGQLFSTPFLYLSALSFVLALSYVLFRLGALGGADVKALIVVALTSPGMVFAHWENQIYEGVMIGAIEILVMVFLGHLYWQIHRRSGITSSEERTVPLIPLLLVGYIIVQMMPFISQILLIG